MRARRAAIGIKTRTGRAVAVALGAPLEFICREELTLCDDRTKQPYHDVMELPWSESIVRVKPAIAVIETIAARELRRIIDLVRSRGFEVASVSVVGPADRQLERIGNPHIRAHAAEGVLFRQVVETAAKVNRVPSKAFVDPMEALTAAQKRRIGNMKAIAGAPWRAEEKLAAAAACAVLNPRRSSAR